jgi:hypothetical protein
MTKFIILQLLSLCQFAFGQESSCPENGPDKIKIRAQYNDIVNNHVYVGYCENLDKNGCPQQLTHPYEDASVLERCRFISNSTDGDYKRQNYQCDSRPQLDKLVDSALRKDWSVYMISN